MVDLLILRGADVNISGRESPLHKAASEGLLTIAKIQMKDEYGRTPLGAARSWRQHDVFEYLQDLASGRVTVHEQLFKSSSSIPICRILLHAKEH